MTVKEKLETGVVKLKPGVRYVRLAADTGTDGIGVVDAQARTVTFSFSSETPVDMWFGTEVLSHAKGCAQLDRINSGGPLLFNHNMDDLLGVVEKAWIGTDKRGYCTVRFGSDERGAWAMQQVQDGILQNVSFMYQVAIFETDTDSDTYTATSWTPYEISLVTVPADPTVGVGRSASSDERDVQIKRSTPSNTPQSSAAADITNQEIEPMAIGNKHVKMNAAIEHAPSGAGTIPAQPAAAPAVDPQVTESARVAEIEAMCSANQIGEETRKALITLKAPLDQARGIVLNELLRRNQGAASLNGGTNPDLDKKEKARYSMLRAINAAVSERMGQSNAWKSAGFEREVSQEIAKRSGKQTAGLFIPTNLQFAERSSDYSFGTGAGLSATSGGSNLVANNLLAGSFIDVLRKKARVMQLGAQTLSGLVGNVTIPRQSAAGQTYWVGEGQVLSQTGANFDSIKFSPKNIGALSVITRDMLQQSTPDVEMLARNDLIKTIALGIDAAALYGTGTNNMPLGIANIPGIGSVIGGVNGAQVTIDNLIDLETQVTAADADVDGMAYLCNAVTVGWLKKLKSTTGQYLWTNNPMGQRSGTPGEINGYTVARSNQARSGLTKGTSATCSELYFGNWADLIIAEWGVIEILPNPYAPGIYEAGGVELRIMQTIDIGARHGQSFSMMSDALTQ